MGTKGKSSGIRYDTIREKERKKRREGKKRSFICSVDERRFLEARAGSFRMIMIFKLKIRGAIDEDPRGSTRDFRTPWTRVRDLSINLYAPLYFSSAATREISGFTGN